MYVCVWGGGCVCSYAGPVGLFRRRTEIERELTKEQVQKLAQDPKPNVVIVGTQPFN